MSFIKKIVVAGIGIAGIVIFIVILPDSDGVEWPDSTTITKLQEVITFPEKNGPPYIDNASQIHLDNDANIYIPDFGKKTIYKFNKEGNLLDEIGRQGRGPGEFLGGGSGTNLEGDTLFIYDGPNARIALFNREGEFLKIRPQQQKYFLLTTSKGLTFGQDIQGAFQNESDHSLINIFDKEGRKISEFGEYRKIDGIGYIPSMASFSEVTIYKDKIYVNYVHFPLMEIYDLNYKLVKSHSLTGVDYLKRVETNYQRDTYKAFNAPSVKKLIAGQDIINNHLFLGIHDDEFIIIDKFDLDGNFIERFIHKVNKDYYMRDLAIQRIDGKLTFYILSENGYFNIRVFERKI